MIEKRVYKKEHIYKEEIMTSFFNLINMKTKLSEKIRKVRKVKKMELLFFLFNQQNDDLIMLCESIIHVSHDLCNPKKIMITTNELKVINVKIRLGNRLISDTIDLIKNYDNKMTRYPRCHHYKNKLHTQLFTELGDILICNECVGTIEACFSYVNDYRSYMENTRMRKLRTVPF